MMARNFVVSAALTFGIAVVGVNVSALGSGATPTVHVAERTSVDHQLAASARASKRAELRAALDATRNDPAVNTAGHTELAMASVPERAY